MICQLCERDVDVLTEHHLIPRVKGGLKGDRIDICVQCSRQIHCMYDNKKLAKKLNTFEKLKKDRKIKNYIEWVRKRNGNFKTKQSW